MHTSNWTLQVLLIVLAFVVYGTGAFGQTLRIATYNVNYANQRYDLILDAIATTKADVICFQETTEELESFLKRELASSHPYFHSVGHKGLYAAERFAFASKVELKNVKFSEPSAGLFGFYSSDANFSGRNVHIVSVHLNPFLISKNSGITGALAALGNTETKHEEEINAILKSLDASEPTIIVGDFNSASTFTAPQRLIASGFLDAYAAVTSEADNHPTWSWPTRPIPLSLRIDYIFHSSHFVTKDSAIIARDGSDHSMVVASLKMK